ncbi:MAG: hypothetical protein QOJ50_715 [Cryptosporangiaceae bacterium]|nr:hypothetical protein [Cryptosporangiaceae bacterium]
MSPAIGVARARAAVAAAAAVLAALVAVGAVVAARSNGTAAGFWVAAPAVSAPPAAGPPAAAALPARPAPPNLPVIAYEPAPPGFAADPDPLSTEHLTEGLHADRRIAAYTTPGGSPFAYLAPDIRGVHLTMPVAARRQGWTAVLLPSANRAIGWVPPGGYTIEPLPDQLVVSRRAHLLTWIRDGRTVQTWPVTLGAPSSPTPLGRSFVLGRSHLEGRVYNGTDVLALGSVPDRGAAIPAGLRGAHIGIHTWYHDRALGKNTSDGCIRLTKSGQQRLLAELAPGTSVVVVE